MPQRAQNHCNSGSSVFRAAIVIRRPYAGSKDHAPASACPPAPDSRGPGCVPSTRRLPPTRTRPPRRHRRRTAHLCAEAGQKYLHERGTGWMPTEACGPRISDRPCDRAPVCQPRCQTEGRMADETARGRAMSRGSADPGTRYDSTSRSNSAFTEVRTRESR